MSSITALLDDALEALRPSVTGGSLIRQYDDGLLAWSPTSASPAPLTGVAAVVLQMLDGSVDVASLVEDVHEVVGIPPGVARAQLRRVLDDLADAGLLDGFPPVNPVVTKLDLFPAPPNP